MKGLSISQGETKDAVYRSSGVDWKTHFRSLHRGSGLLLLFLLSGAALYNAPTAAAQSVSLTWTASTSLVSGYNVYRGTQSGGPYTLLNSSLDTDTTYTDATVQTGQSYYYVATAVNSSGAESAYSNQAEATVPSSSQLSVSPSSINFGSITKGRSAAQTATLTNTGSASVVVSGETVTGTAFSTSGLSLPLTLVGGQSATFTVTFTPTAAGSASGTISVASDATNSPATVSLSGTGNFLRRLPPEPYP
jgi:hypothetical protein